MYQFKTKKAYGSALSTELYDLHHRAGLLYLFGDKSITLHWNDDEYNVDIVALESAAVDGKNDLNAVVHTVEGEKHYIRIRKIEDMETLCNVINEQKGKDVYNSLSDAEKQIVECFKNSLKGCCSIIPDRYTLYEEYKEWVKKYYKRFPSGRLFVESDYDSCIYLLDNSDCGYYVDNYIFAVDLCNGDDVVRVGWYGWDEDLDYPLEDWEYADLNHFYILNKRENLIELICAIRYKLNKYGEEPPQIKGK